MDGINESLDRLGELSDEELGTLEGSILSEFDALEGGDTTKESVAGMTRLADALDSVRGEIDQRAVSAQELMAAREAAAGRVAASRKPPVEDQPLEPTENDPNAPADADPDLTDVTAPDAPVPSDPDNDGDDDSVPGGPGDTDDDGGVPGATPDEVPGGPATPENPDPDADGDDDTTPEGDTDMSHHDADGKPKPGAVSAAAAVADGVTEGTQPPKNVHPENVDSHDKTEPGKVGDVTTSKRGKANGGATEYALEDPAVAEAAVEEEPAAPAEAEAAVEETSEETASEEEQDPATEAAAADNDSTQEKEHPVTASGAEPDITPPADRLPATNVPKIADVPVVITAGADIPGVPAGNELPDMRSVADGMVQRMHSMRRTSGGDGEQHIVASLQAQFPEDRVLRSNQTELNDQKIKAVTSSEALVAAGGLCAPVNVRYDLFGLGQLGRPVKDSLAPFNADRGGIRFITPPKLSDFATAVALWTVQDDIDASTAGAPDPVKPCLRVTCGVETVVLLEAITLCLTFGNLGARAYPEMVARNNELAMIQQARFAETRLLTRIGTLSTAVSAAQVIGASRDFFVQVETAAAGYRSRHRMGENEALRVVAPVWLRNMIRADLTMQIPGNGSDESFGAADSLVDGWFRVRNINVTWHVDGETGQIFGVQGGGTGTAPNRGGNLSGFDASSNVVADTATYTGVQALTGFPSSVVWYLFAEGTFLFLDGGTLDLGLVRDSTLNGTNDYKMFVETFEGVAKVGIESLRIQSTLKVSGASAATVLTN